MKITSLKERISRFLFDGDYSVEKKKIRACAFLPSVKKLAPKANCPQHSVCVSSQKSDSEIWHIGKEYVAPKRGKDLIGRGDLLAKTIIEQSLVIDRDDIPFDGHANLENWPKPWPPLSSSEQEAETKAKWAEIANELSRQAEPILLQT